MSSYHPEPKHDHETRSIQWLGCAGEGSALLLPGEYDTVSKTSEAESSARVNT